MATRTTTGISRSLLLGGSAILLLAGCSREPGKWSIPALVANIQNSVDVEGTRTWFTNNFGLNKTNAAPQLFSVAVENLPNDLRTLLPGATPLQASLEYGPGFSNPNLRIMWGGGFLSHRSVIIGGPNFVFTSNATDLSVTNVSPGVYVIY